MGKHTSVLKFIARPTSFLTIQQLRLLKRGTYARKLPEEAQQEKATLTENCDCRSRFQTVLVTDSPCPTPLPAAASTGGARRRLGDRRPAAPAGAQEPLHRGL